MRIASRSCARARTSGCGGPKSSRRRFRDHPGPKHLVRYEDLHRDPLPHLEPVFDWLGLRVESERLARFVEENTFERLSGGETGPQAFFRAGTPGFWRENLRAEEQAAVEEVIGPKLRELGYDA
jgi:hypothetical protein